MEQASELLAAQLRAELRDDAPQGFHFTDHVIRQDGALERLTEQLRSHGDPSEVAAALSRALLDEQEGWTVLKLLELTERLALTQTAAALMSVATHPPGEGPRQRFLAGRACEVLLRLPLDYSTRQKANSLSAGPLEEMAGFRTGAAKERTSQRPRRVEWAILVALMGVALVGLLLAFLSLER